MSLQDNQSIVPRNFYIETYTAILSCSPADLHGKVNFIFDIHLLCAFRITAHHFNFEKGHLINRQVTYALANTYCNNSEHIFSVKYDTTLMKLA